MKDHIIDRTISFVQDQLKGAEAGHDWFHIKRVYSNALYIARHEQANEFVVALAALLHDIADSKFHNGNEELGPETAATFLTAQGVAPDDIHHVVQIIRNISFKGGNRSRSFQSIEFDIVQDADRLDAIGAIGIARTFHYGGFKNRLLYDPGVLPQVGMTPEAYKRSDAPTINHFYEKLLLLKDLMNTKTGRKLAEERHGFMEQFLRQFYREWESADLG